MSNPNNNEEFTQESYEKLFSMLQAFFNIRTELKNAVKHMQQVGYTPTDDATIIAKQKNAYKTCADWEEAMSSAVSQIANDVNTYRWLSKTVDDFKRDMLLFKQITKIDEKDIVNESM